LTAARERGEPVDPLLVELLLGFRAADEANRRGLRNRKLPPPPLSLSEVTGTGAAAAVLGCSPQWVRTLCASGELPGARRVGKDWLIPNESIESYRKDHPR
jgi:excisionase family DNA binding protein